MRSRTPPRNTRERRGLGGMLAERHMNAQSYNTVIDRRRERTNGRHRETPRQCKADCPFRLYPGQIVNLVFLS